MNFHNFQYNHELDESSNFWNYLYFCKEVDRDLYYTLSKAGAYSQQESMRVRVKKLQQKQKIFTIYYTSYKILNFPKYDYAEFVLALMAAIGVYSSFENNKIAYEQDLIYFYPKKPNKPRQKFVKNNSKINEKKEKNFFYFEKFSKDKRKHVKKYKRFNKKTKKILNKHARRSTNILIQQGRYDEIYLSNKKIVGNGFELDW